MRVINFKLLWQVRVPWDLSWFWFLVGFLRPFWRAQHCLSGSVASHFPVMLRWEKRSKVWCLAPFSRWVDWWLRFWLHVKRSHRYENHGVHKHRKEWKYLPSAHPSLSDLHQNELTGPKGKANIRGEWVSHFRRNLLALWPQTRKDFMIREFLPQFFSTS